MSCTHAKILGVALAGAVSLTGAASCGSTDEAPLGTRVQHPDPRAPRRTSSANDAVNAGSSSPAEPFSALDKVIALDCREVNGLSVSRPWSQNVPDRDCASDDECGDGFCDRGRCAAIWTCGERIGQRCVNGEVAPNPRLSDSCHGLCLEGRCRSCVSDEECVKKIGVRDAICNPGKEKNGGRICAVIGFHGR